MKKTILTLMGLIMGFVYTLNAQQTIEFFDESTWQPLAGVKVQMGSDILISDPNGKISINEVFSSTMVSISHPDYESMLLSYSLIMEKKYKIEIKEEDLPKLGTIDDIVVLVERLTVKRKNDQKEFPVKIKKSINKLKSKSHIKIKKNPLRSNTKRK